MAAWDAATVAKAKAAEARMCAPEQRRMMNEAFVRIFEIGRASCRERV